MGNRTNPAKWEARQRLEFIELAAYWRGWVRRADLQKFFGISLPQASADFQAYLSLNPGSLAYDLRRKRYFASAAMRPRLIQPDLAGAIGIFLGHERKAGAGDRVATLDLPYRRVSSAIARRVFQAVHEGMEIEIHYLSIHSATATWRWISPHAFGFDGHRWHVRAWCYEDQIYKDFVLGRIAGLRNEKKAERLPRDTDWTTWINLRLKPDPSLTETQRKALEADYAMRGGVANVRVRRAMKIYTLAQLGISSDDRLIPARLKLASED